MRRLSLFLVLLFPALALGGQTAVDKLITRLTGVPITALYDLDARLDTLEGAGSASYVRRLTVAVGAEVADHRTFTVTIKGADGNTVAGADSLRIAIYNNELATSLANDAVWPVADVGAGSIGTTLGGGSQAFMATTAAGVLELDVNDIGGGSNTTVWAVVELRHDGSTGLTSAPILVPLTFDAL